jgi:uncharacterized protein YndB with AHSA1/START domain
MTTIEKTTVTVSTSIHAPVHKVWELWTEPHHILHWNNASVDWVTTRAENDLRPGGKFLARMEARDGSSGFDFTGEYTAIRKHKQIAYTMDDGRKVNISFFPRDYMTEVTESFDAEQVFPVEIQRSGWQSILDNFRKYAESDDRFEVLHFETHIGSPVENVFNTMTDYHSYKCWTSVFNSFSEFKGSWEKGSVISFLSKDEEGGLDGMAGRIRENIPGKFISIEYTGIIKNGKEILDGPEADEMKGALENYSFSTVRNKTAVTVDIDTTQHFKCFLIQTWPRALEKLKSMCEI